MIPFESPESSSPIVTRAVSAGLRNLIIDNYNFPGWQKALLNAMGFLPERVSRFVISRFQTISGLPPEVMDGFSLEGMLKARLGDYDVLTGRFPAICAGAALGGATTYLSLALGGPFLPQTFVFTIKGGSKTGDVNEYLHRSLASAMKIASENPGLMTIQHFDPVHDGYLTCFVNHLRFKLIDLPETYVDFIRSHLEPGGAVVFLDGGAKWLRYRLGPRSIFQVGGWGGIPAEEFLHGSERISTYARRTGLKSDSWALDEKEWPLELGPESEWGSEPGLAESLQAFCKTEGYRFLRIPLPHPNDFSRLAFRCAQTLLAKEDRTPAGTLVEVFTQFDALSARQGGLLPLWLIFNTEDSLEYLKEMKKQFPVDKPVFFSPLATFSLTPDLVTYKKWAAALEGFPWINIGARESHFPADSRALVQWAEPLRKWVAANPNPLISTIQAEELLSLVK